MRLGEKRRRKGSEGEKHMREHRGGRMKGGEKREEGMSED